MRNAVRVLFKFAQIQQAQSSFSKVPTPKAIYMIYLWLTEKSALTHSFNNVRKVTPHPGLKYQEKQRNADVLLQNFVYYRVFRAWLRHSKKVRAFRKHIEHRLLGSVVDAWFAQSRANAVFRRKARAVRDQS